MSESSEYTALDNKTPPPEDHTKKQVSVNVSLTLGIKTVYYILLVMATMGTLMLWFEADQLRGVTYWSSPQQGGGSTASSTTAPGTSTGAGTGHDGTQTGNVHPFTNLWIALIMFMSVDLSDTFIPSFAKKLVRTFATFMFFFNIDRAICTLNTYTLMGDGENHVYNSPDEINQRNMGRMGAPMVVIPAMLVFLMAYFRRVPNFNGLLQGGIPSLIFFVRIIAILLMIIAQIMVWSIKTSCAGPAWGYAAGAMTQFTIMVQLVLMISGCFFADNEAYDLSLMLSMYNLFTYLPVFDDVKAVNGNQDSFPGIWRTEVSMMFIGSILYSWCAFCDAPRDKSKTLIERIKSVPFIAQLICAVFGFAAAICIWVRSPEPHKDVTYLTKMQVYIGCYALIIPFYSMLSTITGSRIIHLFCLGYTALVGFHVASLLSNGIWGYLRGGFILQMFICFICVLIEYFVSSPSVKPVHEYFEGDNKVDVMVSGIITYFAALGYESGRIDYLLWFALALYIFFGRLTDSHDISRISYFFLMWFLTNTSSSVAFWPLLPGQGPKVLESTLFVVGVYYIWRFASTRGEYNFESVHYFTGEKLDHSLTFQFTIANNTAEGKYQSVDASPSKSESLLTTSNTTSPRNREDGTGGYQAAEISDTETSPRSSTKEKKSKKSRSRSSSVSSVSSATAEENHVEEA